MSRLVSPRRLAALAPAALVAALIAAPSMAAEFVARIGHLESPQQSRHVHLEIVAERVADRTGGAVQFQLFPQSQLGNQREMTEGVQLGVIEGTVAPAAFLGGFNPAVSILDIPFFYPADPDAAQAIREGAFGDALLGSFADKGVVAVALWPNGAKNFTSRKTLESIADFEGQKFRVMDSRILIEQFNAVGATATAIPFSELYTALQTGVVDGQENPLDTIQKMKFYEVQENLVLSNHGAMEDVALFNPVWWNSLPEEYRTIIQDAFLEVIPDLRAHKAQAVEAALDEIKASGMNVRELSDDERTELREAMFPAARDAYLERAGEAGAALIEAYEAALAATN